MGVGDLGVGHRTKPGNYMIAVTSKFSNIFTRVIDTSLIREKKKLRTSIPLGMETKSCPSVGQAPPCWQAGSHPLRVQLISLLLCMS